MKLKAETRKIIQEVESQLIDKFAGQHNTETDILSAVSRDVWYNVECKISDEILHIVQFQIFMQIQNIMHNTFHTK